MTWIEGIILGMVQGLTEFLPVSSSGHLVLFQKIFGVSKNVLSFDVAVHFATLIAVCLVLRKDIAAIIKKPLGKLPMLIVAGTIPTIIIGLLFKDVFQKLYESGASLGFEFILTGVVLWLAEGIKTKNKGIEKMNYADAVIIGTAQGLAILPAVSRSGLTLAGALFRGLNRESALKFSFLMSIPAILGPALLDAYNIFKGGNTSAILPDAGAFVFGMLAAGISGYIAVKFMLKIFAKTSLKIFSFYVFVLGALVLIDQIFFGRFFERLF